MPAMSWYEFVLNEKLLEEHLLKENPGTVKTRTGVSSVNYLDLDWQGCTFYTLGCSVKAYKYKRYDLNSQTCTVSV